MFNVAPCTRAARILLIGTLVSACPVPALGQDHHLNKIARALPDTVPAQAKQPRKILIFTRTTGFRHN
jgi:hypothetical protein